MWNSTMLLLFAEYDNASSFTDDPDLNTSLTLTYIGA